MSKGGNISGTNARALEVRVQVTRRILSPAAAATLKRLNHYEWLLFTSARAVTFFARELRERQIPRPNPFPYGPRIAAVGPVTAQALHNHKFPVALVPERFTAEQLIRSLGTVRGARILFPRSIIAPAVVVSQLRREGARVTMLPLYTASAMRLQPATKCALLAGAYQELIFKSPSGVKGLLMQLTKREQIQIRSLHARCIGPTTAGAARALGFKNVFVQGIV